MTGLAWGRSASARWSVGATMAALVVMAALLGGCLFGADDSASADDRALQNDRDLVGACSSPRTYFPQADAYTGNAPHPIMAFSTSDTGSVNEVQTLSWSSNRPQQWLAVDPPRYQLVACLGKAEADEFLQNCSFDSGTVPLHRGRYQVTVFEARTGKEVAREQMRGAGLDGSNRTCPSIVWLNSSRPMLYTEPDLAEFHSVLGKYVDRTMGADASPTAPQPPRPVTDLSGLCGKVGPALPDAIKSVPLKDTESPGPHQTCVWEPRGADRLRLRMRAEAHAGYGAPGSGSVENARKNYDISTETMGQYALAPGLEPVPGLGDLATVAHQDGSLRVGTGSNVQIYPGTDAHLIVLVRNVTIDISWSGANLGYETAKAEVIALAHQVIAQLPR
ncbi:hypothetical protein ACFQZZ_15140 [Nocardia sp. GCM10030253]|uniref:hypothetical protein n=1 Tax=Nocardia sp. GCM10030253 TaxID=3273404 RepID=UPI00362BE9F0